MAAIKYIKRTVSLDGSPISETLPATFFSGEQSAHTFIIAGKRDGEDVLFSGYASATFLNPNNEMVTGISSTIVDGTAVVTLSDACYHLEGRFILTISVNGAVVYECNSHIKRRVSGSAYDPSDVVPNLEELMAEISNMRTATAAANTAAEAASAVAENVNIDVVEGTNDATIFITNAAGTTKSATISKVAGDDYNYLKNITDNIAQQTRNLWTHGDVICEGPVDFYDADNALLPAGTYTLSAQIDRETARNCRVLFYKGKGSDLVKLAEPYIPSGERGNATFTLSEDCHYMRFYSGLAYSETARTEWNDIQIELGSEATDFIKPYAAVDGIAREAAEKNSNDVATMMTVLEKTPNIWLWGDQYANKQYVAIKDNVDIPAGTYTLSAVVESNGSNKSCRMAFYDANGTQIAFPYLTGDKTRRSTAVVLGSTCKQITIYPGVSYNAGNEVSWVDVQLEAGSVATPYSRPVTSVDSAARHPSNQIQELIGEFTGGSGGTTINVTIEPDRITQNPVLYVFDAMYEYTGNPVVAYPYFAASIYTIKNLLRSTSRMRIGELNEYQVREFRGVPYIWDNRPNRLTVYIPEGIKLTVRNAYIQDGRSQIRMTGGLKMHAHEGECNVVREQSLSAAKAAIAAGHNSFIVIPKVSKATATEEPVWFAYHDDTLNVSTTYLRQWSADDQGVYGYHTLDDTYNGQPFHNIPWSYLAPLSIGVNYDDPAHLDYFSKEHLMRLDDFFALCAKTGIAPMFSFHPSPTNEVKACLPALKNLLKKYGILNKLIIKVPLLDDNGTYGLANLTALFDVFGNDIASYEVDALLAMSNPAAVIPIVSNARSANSITVPMVIEWWITQFYAEGGENLIADAIAAGFGVSCANTASISHTDPGGYTVTQYTSEDIAKLSRLGVTEFTNMVFMSNGLCW